MAEVSPPQALLAEAERQKVERIGYFLGRADAERQKPLLAKNQELRFFREHPRWERVRAIAGAIEEEPESIWLEPDPDKQRWAWRVHVIFSMRSHRNSYERHISCDKVYECFSDEASR